MLGAVIGFIVSHKLLMGVVVAVALIIWATIKMAKGVIEFNRNF